MTNFPTLEGCLKTCDYHIVTLVEDDDYALRYPDWVNGYSIEHKTTCERVAWFPVPLGHDPRPIFIDVVTYFLKEVIALDQ